LIKTIEEEDNIFKNRSLSVPASQRRQIKVFTSTQLPEVRWTPISKPEVKTEAEI